MANALQGSNFERRYFMNSLSMFGQKSELYGMIRFTPPSKAELAVGKILLSEPFLSDAYFGRKAILLCEHNDEGSFGFVLNNFVQVDLNELLEELPEWDARISLGGPVKHSNLYYLHTKSNAPGAVQVMEGLFMGGDFEWLKSVIDSGVVQESELRFFIGYAGWTPGQLESEIKSHSWFVTETSIQNIMDTSVEEESFWKQLIEGMGKGFGHIANAPSDPSLN
jgi:putative transcriptional regulator